MSPPLQSDTAKIRAILANKLNTLKRQLNGSTSSIEQATIAEEISKINEDIELLKQHKNPHN